MACNAIEAFTTTPFGAELLAALKHAHANVDWVPSSLLQANSADLMAPSTYFVSHAWSYKFSHLVELVLSYELQLGAGSSKER